MGRTCLLQIAFLLCGATASASPAMVRPAHFQQSDDAQSSHELGLERYKSGRYEEALEAFKQTIRLEPGWARAQNDLGVTYLTLGRFADAVEALQRAIKLAPDYALARYNLGGAYRNMGRYEEAVSSYREALRLKPDYAAAYNNLGHPSSMSETVPPKTNTS